MTSSARKILEHALALSENERRLLGEALLDSVPRVPEEDVRQAWVDEAVRRSEAVEHGEGELLDLDAALTGLKAHFSNRATE